MVSFLRNFFKFVFFFSLFSLVFANYLFAEKQFNQTSYNVAIRENSSRISEVEIYLKRFEQRKDFREREAKKLNFILPSQKMNFRISRKPFNQYGQSNSPNFYPQNPSFERILAKYSQLKIYREEICMKKGIVLPSKGGKFGEGLQLYPNYIDELNFLIKKVVKKSFGKPVELAKANRRDKGEISTERPFEAPFSAISRHPKAEFFQKTVPFENRISSFDLEKIVKEESELMTTTNSLILERKPGIIRGKIVDNSSDIPTPGAILQISGTNLSVVSDDSGSFEFSQLPSGSYNLIVYRAGFEKQVFPQIFVP